MDLIESEVQPPRHHHLLPGQWQLPSYKAFAAHGQQYSLKVKPGHAIPFLETSSGLSPLHLKKKKKRFYLAPLSHPMPLCPASYSLPSLAILQP